jgi:hypothetical protein
VPKPTRKSRPCTICQHVDRALIEQAHCAGVGGDAIAKKHKVGRDAVYRHCRNHLTEEARASYIAEVPIREMAAKAAAQAGSLMDYFELVRAALFRNFQIAAEHGDIQATNNTARALTEVLREIGRLTGELLTASQVTNIQTNNYNFAASAEFAALQAMLVQRLAPFPEALAAVLAGLEALDANAAHGAPQAQQRAIPAMVDITPMPSAPTEEPSHPTLGGSLAGAEDDAHG